MGAGIWEREWDLGAGILKSENLRNREFLLGYGLLCQWGISPPKKVRHLNFR